MALRFATDSSPFLIAGPCVVESDDLNVRVGEALAELAVKLGIGVIYKASYDKANRSRLNAPRGPGIESGLRALEKVRSATGLPILTDVHEPCHVAIAASVADVLQIAAFLCRQTDLLVAAARAAGAFRETHPDPARRPAEGPNVVPLGEVAGIGGLAVDVWVRVRGGETVRA